MVRIKIIIIYTFTWFKWVKNTRYDVFLHLFNKKNILMKEKLEIKILRLKQFVFASIDVKKNLGFLFT